MGIRSIRHQLLAAALAAMLAVVAGCGGRDAASYLASAQSYAAKSDYRAAIIEVKNSLQQNPDSPEARLLLAKLLLDTGDPVGAETETRKAIALGPAGDPAYLLLARTLASRGEFRRLVEELGGRKLDNPASRAELGAAVARAYFAQGDVRNGGIALAAAAREQPEKNVQVLLLQAQVAGQEGKMDVARSLVDKALTIAPESLDASLMKVDIALIDGKQNEAADLLDRSITAHPASLAARFGRMSLALKMGKLDTAKAQLAKMKEIQAGDFRSVYGDAMVAFAGNDFARARDSTQRVLAASPDHLPSLLLFGLVNLHLGSYAVAEDSLLKVVARAPDNVAARRALAGIYLRNGRGQQALDTLAPALRAAPNDPALLRIAGEAYLAVGKSALAATSYERANAIDKENVGGKVRLAQVRLATGDAERAFADLEALSQSESSEYQADLALFTEHMRRREFDKALRAVDALEKKQPKSAFVPNLRGIAFLAQGDLKQARAHFDRALEMQPDFYSAAFNLATIDMREGRAQAARDRYERLLQKNPNNEELLLASADVLSTLGGAPSQVRAGYERAVSANPASVRARLALIGFDARHRDAKGTLASAQAAVNAIPNSPPLLDSLASAYVANRELGPAADTLRKLVQLQPQNPMPLLRLAEVQTAMKEYAPAIENQRKALSLNPDLTQAWAALAKTYLQSGRADAVIAEARKLQKERPDKALGFALEGEVQFALKKWNEAASAFRNALARQAAPALAVRNYLALSAAGKPGEATAFADKWIREHPSDASLPILLAEQHQRRKDYAAAQSAYERVLAIDDDSVVALNNLAWILTEKNDRKGLEYAERAHRAAPFNPNVLDTLGWAVTKSGDAKRGVELLRIALALSPVHPEIRLHLAQALAQAGDKSGAGKEIAELVKLDQSSPVRAAAEKLRSTL